MKPVLHGTGSEERSQSIRRCKQSKSSQNNKNNQSKINKTRTSSTTREAGTASTARTATEETLLKLRSRASRASSAKQARVKSKRIFLHVARHSLSLSLLFAVWSAFSFLVLLLGWFSSLFPLLERLGELIGNPAGPRRSSFLNSGALFFLSFAPLGVEARPGNPYFQ